MTQLELKFNSAQLGKGRRGAKMSIATTARYNLLLQIYRRKWGEPKRLWDIDQAWSA